MDDADRARIEHETDVGLAVSAGAGSGKTEALVRRILALFRAGCAPGQVVAITFTVRAAAELRERVLRRLELAAADERAEWARSALRALPEARISTIDALCSDIVRANALEAGVPLTFRTASGLSQRRLNRETFERWAAEAAYEPPRWLAAALNAGVTLDQLRSIATAFVGESAAVRGTRSEPPAETEWDGAEGAAAALQALLPACVSADDKGLAAFDGLLDQFETVRSASGDRRVRELLRLGKPQSYSTRGSQKNWKPVSALGVAREQAGRLQNALQAERRHVGAAIAAEAVAGMLAAETAAAEERRAAGSLSFGDVLGTATAVLAESPSVQRRAFPAGSRLLVDEFQDTNARQAAFFAALLGEPHWDSAVDRGLADGRLFVVGDPKQSIYRFRGADFSVFGGVLRRAPASRRAVLSRTFRAVPELAQWANRVFGAAFEHQEGLQAGYEPLDAHRDPAGGPRVTLARSVGTSGEPTTADEAGIAAALVRSLVGADGAAGRDPSRYGGIVVLAPSRPSFEAVACAFEAAGIPFRTEQGGRFYERQEVADIAVCLRAIADPGDTISVLAALRSAALGCSDEELALFVLDGGDFARVRRVPGSPVDAALGRLDAWRLAARSLALPDLVALVLEESGRDLVAYAVDGAQAAANADKLVGLADDFERGGGNLAEFAALLAEDNARGDEDDADVADHGADTVRLSTIHGAKGLEFPHVIVLGLGRNGRASGGPFFGPSGEVEHRFGSAGRGVETSGYEDQLDRERAADAAERLRLAYVACTRARESLAVVIPKEPKKASTAAALLDAIDPDGGHPDQVLWERPSAEFSPSPPAASQPGLGREVEAWRRSRQARLPKQRVVAIQSDEGWIDTEE